MSTQTESYNKIVHSGNGGMNSAFVVTMKNGVQYRYEALGYGSGTFLGYVPRVLQQYWLLKEIRDPQATANVVSFQYDITSSAPRLRRISYGGYTVDFNYEFRSRALATFPLHASSGTAMGSQNYRLKSITIADGSAKIRAYRLAYTDTAATQASLLTSVREYGSDYQTSGVNVVGGTALPAKTFTYSGDTMSLTEQFYSRQFNSYAAVWDFDGDQRDDIVLPQQDFGLIQWTGVYVPRTTMPRGHIGFNQDRTIKDHPNGFIPRSYGVTTTHKLGRSILGLRANQGRNGPKLMLWQQDRTVSELYSIYSTRRPYLYNIASNGSVASSLQVDYNYERAPDSWFLAELDGDTAPEFVNTDIIPGNNYSSPITELRKFKNQATNGQIYNFNPSGMPYSAPYLREARPVDLDADGITDFVEDLEHSYDGRLQAMEVTGNVLRRRELTVDEGTCSTLQFDPWQHGEDEQYSYAFGDVNGDMQSDLIVYYFDDSYSGGDQDAICVGLGTRNGFNPLTVWNSPGDLFSGPFPGTKNYVPDLHLADLNGDGLTDLLVSHRSKVTQGHGKRFPGDARIFLSTASSFVPKPAVASGGGGGFRGIGSGSSSTTPPADIVEYVAMGDFDGDGRMDFASMRGAGGYNCSNPELFYMNCYSRGARVYWSQSEPPNALIAIDDEKGARTEIAYKSSSVSSDNDIPRAMQVVASITVKNGRGDERTTLYNYFGAKYDFVRKKPLGFRQVTTYLPSDEGPYLGLSTKAYYHNTNLANRGKLERKEVIWRHANGATVHQRTENEWEFSFAGNGPYSAKLVKTINGTRNGGLIYTAQAFTENLFGERTSITDYGFTNYTGDDLAPGDNTHTVIEYEPNTSKYIVNLPKSQKVFAGATSSSNTADWINREFYFYDGAANNNTPPTSGNMTVLKHWERDTNTNTDSSRLGYDARGNVLYQEDGLGNRTTFTYDTARHLFRETETNAATHVTTTAWNTVCQQPASMTDANGLVTTYTYDPLCRITRRDLPTTNYVTTAYLNFGDPDNQQVETRTLSGSTLSNAGETVERKWFDGYGETYRTEMSGRTNDASDLIVMRQSYDALGRVVAASIPLSPSEAAASSLPNDRLVRTSYDAIGRITEVINPDGSRVTQAYESAAIDRWGANLEVPVVRVQDENCHDSSTTSVCGQSWTMTDHRGSVVQTDKEDSTLQDVGATQIRSVTQYFIDRAGNLTSVIDPSGAQWHYTYDAFGNRLTADDPSLGFWTMEYDRAHNLKRQTDAKGNVITFDYDALNRVTRKVVNPVDGPSVTTTMAYDQDFSSGFNKGQLTQTGIWDPDNARHLHRIRFAYDEGGKVLREYHHFEGQNYNVHYKYLPSGHLEEQSLPKTPSSNLSNWTGETYAYDASGRMISFGSLISDVSYDLRSQPTSVTFGSGVQSTYTYSRERGWLDAIEVTAEEIPGSAVGGVPIGEAGSVTFSQSNATQWHSVSFTLPITDAIVVLGPLTRNGSDPSTTRIRNVTDTGFEFQLDEWDYRDGGHISETVSWLAVSEGAHTLENGSQIVAGRDASVGTGGKSVSLGATLTNPIVLAEVTTVNEPNALTTRIQNVGATSFSIRIQEEEAGGAHTPETVDWIAIESGVSPGFEAGRTPDELTHTVRAYTFASALPEVPALLGELQTRDGGDTSTLRMTALSTTGLSLFVEEEKSKDNEIGHTTEAAGFVALRPGMLYSEATFTPPIPGGIVSSTSYTRNPTGQIAQVDSNLDEGDYSFAYDYAGRLLSADNPNTNALDQTFTFYRSGSIASNSHIGDYYYSGFVPAFAPETIVTSAGAQTLTYDANGNMLTGFDGKVMTYDGENRPLSVTKDGVTTSYVYGADGTRLKTTVNGETTITFGPVEIRDFAGTTTGDVMTYPHADIRFVNGVAEAMHRDQLSSLRAITDGMGALVAERSYKPFGEITVDNKAVGVTSETKGYIGERFDEDAGLQYLNARYYDPALGLFIQPDWFDVTVPGVGTNRYSYCFNDPINCLDPSGNQAKPADPDEEIEEPDKPKTAEDTTKPQSEQGKGGRLKDALKKGGGILGLLQQGWQLGQTLEELNNDQNRLFRGLSQRDIHNLLNSGAILPHDEAGTLTMEEHAIDSAGSQFISLTTDSAVAEHFATIDELASGFVAEFDGQKLQFSGGLRHHDVTGYGDEARSNVLNESEVLYEGRIPAGAVTRIYKAPQVHRGPTNGN